MHPSARNWKAQIIHLSLNKIREMVGNSMHVNVVGIVMLWCLVSPKRVDTLPGMREFSMLKRAHNFGSN